MKDKNPVSHDVEQWIEKQAPRDENVEISVVVPAYNEQWRLPPTLIDMIDFFDGKGLPYEVIVVDDGSQDLTSTIVRKFERIRPQVRLLRAPQNHGKGYALRMGVLNSRGKRVLIADADGATPIMEFERLTAALDGGADVAIGSRAMASATTTVTTNWYRKLLGRSFNLVVNLFLLPGIADTQCGFKMFTEQAARFLFERQTADGFSFDVEILYLAKKTEMKIAEIPINWTNVPGSKVNLVLDAMKMFHDIFFFRFRHRGIDRSAFRSQIEATQRL